ncbi:MAG: cytosine permease [Nitrososphaerota archaeon]
MAENGKTEAEINKLGDMTYDPKSGIVELNKEFPEYRMFWGKEFHPIPKSARRWGYLPYIGAWATNFSPIWWSISAAIIAVGLSLWYGLVAIIIEASAIYVIVIAQSHAGTRYGLAEPQLTRMRWGLFGGWIASTIRFIPALGWFGINSYMFTEMADGLYLLYIGKLSRLASIASSGPLAEFSLNPFLFITIFVIVFLSQGAILSFSKIIRSQVAVKWLFLSMTVIGPLSAILLWGHTMNLVHWNLGLLFAPSMPHTVSLNVSYLFLVAISSAMAATITISMSNPDILRFAKNQKVQILSQLFLIPFFFLIWFFGMSAAVATYLAYGSPIYDPYLLAFILNIPVPLKVFLVLVMGYATFGIQIYANLIPPSYDISNFVPGKLKFWMGVVISLVIAAIMQAWGLYLNALSFLEDWMNLYGTFLSPVVGIAVFDYLIIRRLKIPVDQLYIPKGKFWYFHGFNPAAIIATVIPVLLILIPQVPYHTAIYSSSTIIGFVLGAIIYLILMKWWVIPKWQPFLKGGMIHGYKDMEIEPLFMRSKGGMSKRSASSSEPLKEGRTKK